MEKILCVPNFSEGRNAATLDALARAISSVAGVSLLDYSADASHNRSVFTFTGEPSAVCEAAFAAARAAKDLIDLTRHEGGHPRMGAADVIPFVPIDDGDMEICVRAAHALGARLWNELEIPVFLYDEAARIPSHRDLSNLRRGGFEGMAKKIQTPDFTPDFGDRLHKTAGITAVGARLPLIAFNMNLDVPDISVAKKIASEIRESSGGLPKVKAIGVFLEEGGVAQVSTNLTDYRVTPIHAVLERVREAAKRYGARVVETEIIGTPPSRALADSAKFYLGLKDFDVRTRLL